MANNYVERFSVKGLWGRKDRPIDLHLHRDVNVIIGPNASGKTTLINILYDVMNCNLTRLSRTQFSDVAISLQSFDGTSKEEVRVKMAADTLTITVQGDKYPLPLPDLQRLGEEGRHGELPIELMYTHRMLGGKFRELQTRLRSLTQAVWLPVSRRLPIAQEEEMARRSLHRKPLESVDECLSGLVESLSQYRVLLNTELAELRKQFQSSALKNILYDKQHDGTMISKSSFVPPTDLDKQALLKAFADVGLIDKKTSAQIDEHFEASTIAVRKFAKKPQDIDIQTLFIIPLISRTRALVRYAQELEENRERLFESIHSYENIVNSFLNDKTLQVGERGELIISQEHNSGDKLDWRHLSSGEKQILILLTQALLTQKTPVVYVADEPELSLHVTWQEKLLPALTRLAGKCQFIVATHSPDIASGFGDKIIDLGRPK